MINELSRKVYHEIIAEGLVGELQGRVAGALVDSEPLTANEIGKKIEVPQRTTFAPRLLELEKRGVVRKAGKRPCTVTGRTGHTFELTGRKPMAATSKNFGLVEGLRAELAAGRAREQSLQERLDRVHAAVMRYDQEQWHLDPGSQFTFLWSAVKDALLCPAPEASR